MSKLCVLVKNDGFSDILNEFQEVTTPCIQKCRLLGKVEHHIDTRCRRPVFSRARRLSPDKLAAAKEEFKKLLEMDVIQPSNSPWSSPLHMVENRPGVGELAEIAERKIRPPRMIVILCHNYKTLQFSWRERAFSARLIQ